MEVERCSNEPVMTLMSGTFSGARSTVLGFRSKASRSSRFFAEDPHSRYSPIISRPRRSISSMHRFSMSGILNPEFSLLTTTSRSTPKRAVFRADGVRLNVCHASVYLSFRYRVPRGSTFTANWWTCNNDSSRTLNLYIAGSQHKLPVGYRQSL